VPALWIAPSEGGPLRVKGTIERPFFDDVKADAPLMGPLSLRDVNIRRAQRVEVEPDDEVLGRSTLGPLIVKGVRAGQPFIALTFDAAESDLVLRTAWPVLIAGVIQQLTAAGEGAFEPSLTVGETRQFELSEATAVLEGPAGDRTTLVSRNGRVEFKPTHPGFYELSTRAAKRQFAVNPNPEATVQIKPSTFAAAPANEQPLASAISTRDVASWTLLALAMALLASDAWLLARRRSR
jgi:hypothetical protein